MEWKHPELSSIRTMVTVGVEGWRGALATCEGAVRQRSTAIYDVPKGRWWMLPDEARCGDATLYSLSDKVACWFSLLLRSVSCYNNIFHV
jgi:hypothetical protein